MPRWPPPTGPELLRAQWREAAEAGAHRATVVGVTTEVRTTTIITIEEEATIITTEATITTTGEATITTTITTEAEATTATIEEEATMFTSEVEATMSTSEEVTIVTTVEEASIVTTEVEATIVTEEARPAEARSAEVLAASISSFFSISRPSLHHLLGSAARRQHPLLPFKSPVRVTRSKVSFKFVEITSRMLMMDTVSKLQIDDRLLLNFLSLSVEPRECFQII